MHDKLVWAEVDLDAITHNIRALKARVGEPCKLMAVVKANAYGHGAVPIARTAVEAGAEWLGVNSPDEGIHLRGAGIKTPIFITGYTPVWQADEVVRYRLTPIVTTQELAQALSHFSTQSGIITPVHVKVDTGMNRFGLSPEEVVDFARFMKSLPGLEVEGLCSHLATADEADKTFAWQQFHLFMSIARELPWIPLRHIANSAAILDLPQTSLDIARAGISIYGIYPSPQVSRPIELKPALAIKSRITRLQTLAPGNAVSYGRTWIARMPTRIAVVNCGYFEGLPRSLSNRGSVLVQGRRVPILGRICMDHCLIDVTSVPQVHLDDEVVIIGRQGSKEISADEVAQLAGTISYEILCSISSQVTRIYLRGGEKE